ncbi:thymopoietin isoform 2-T2 [Discoglossus pictus]
MPEFLEDPAVLTKDKLKSELVANNVSLPAGDQRKDVYVQLYLQHLTSRNRGTPDFSSDEEREATPVRSRGRPTGRKATKKTDKPRAEEKDEPDVTELSNEALKEELIKYGMNPGPILGSTRKVYEQRLLKLKEEGSLASSKPSVADSSTADSGKQNGNTDSEQYSDNEEEPKIDLTFEKREPLRGKPKAQVTLRNRRTEQQEKISEDTVTETTWTSGASKTGRLQAVSKESTRVSRRTPRKMVVAAEPFTFDDADISETAPVTETIMPSSNQTAYTTYEHFESRKVVNQVPESFKHSETLLSVNDFSEFSRRTPKKQLISEKVVEKTFVEEKRTERDILKDLFPHEASTPTGISASCRRPIKGAAGRPFNPKDYKLEENYSSKYVSKYTPAVDVKSEKVKPKQSIAVWIKILFFLIVAVICFFVYQAMETNERNPFAKYLQGTQETSQPAN